MQDEVARFLEMLDERRALSGNTVAAYRNDLAQFTQFLADGHGVQSWQMLTSHHLEHFLTYLYSRKYADTTVARKISAVKSFCRYLYTRGVLHENLAAQLPTPRTTYFKPRAITPSEVAALLNTVAIDDSPEGLRDYAMFLTLYSTGMRVSELTALNVSDVSLHEARIRIGRQTPREREVPVNEETVGALERYLEEGRPQLVCNNRGELALFINHRGKRLTRQGFWLILKRYADLAGIPDITPHILRHSFAFHALEQGWHPAELQRVLGHLSLSTTLAYQHLLRQGDHRQHRVTAQTAASWDDAAAYFEQASHDAAVARGTSTAPAATRPSPEHTADPLATDEHDGTGGDNEHTTPGDGLA
ncbi:MAG: tyrosine-type recombinase/integrase [Thermorudis peleae]|nr:tyrosine-type recombinase/integrase [Thermorudis peleae]